ncbi:MAG: electron transfer flavoprotein subunit alpha/FixB family protein [Burkholderiales bacterium]|jgi:electron transfer flavoprotein alpha subunit|nr:electron transfer flavoprotein subunit alpha/FixB family protein [Burkholderiales bacterium]
MTVLILAEYTEKHIKNVTASVVTAALQISDDVHVLILSDEKNAPSFAGQAAKLKGVSQVFAVGADYLKAKLTEDASAQIQMVLAQNTYTHILMSSSYSGKRVMPYLAGKLGQDCASDCVVIDDKNLFVRPIYASSLYVVEKLFDEPKLVSVRASAFAPCGSRETPAPITYLTAAPAVSRTRHIGSEITAETSGIDLTCANIVIGIGRGVTRAELPLIEKLAVKLHAAIGATRAVVEEGLISSSAMLGQTGKIIAPDLYIAIGISGAIQHLAGVKDSKVIVAINEDIKAPIFQVADYGIVGDLKTLVPEMIEAL